MNARSYTAPIDNPHVIDVIEPASCPRPTARVAAIGDKLKLNTEGLEAYFFADWQPTLVDLLVIAAAVEHCDATFRRPARGWARAFDVLVAVHDQKLWDSDPVRETLEEALVFLTGDNWSFSFTCRNQPEREVKRRHLPLNTGTKVIIPYSDGLDSRAVAALVRNVERNALVSVRLGTKGKDNKRGKPFTTVPYQVKFSRHERVESSARTRGFKFAVITGIAAHLAGAKRIVVTESGQGALGPVLAVTGHIYPDYRVHPAFTRKIERLFEALTSRKPTYEFPRLWYTKGETLAAANSLSVPPRWDDTRSCWQSSQHVSINHKRRQCGICAACMLRRMSMKVAGITEAPNEYIWENLSASDIEDGVAEGFTRITNAHREYAIAGILHLDHMAELATSSLHMHVIKRASREVADALGGSPAETETKLMHLLSRHRAEWLDFLGRLGPQSFVSKIALVSPWQ